MGHRSLRVAGVDGPDVPAGTGDDRRRGAGPVAARSPTGRESRPRSRPPRTAPSPPPPARCRCASTTRTGSRVPGPASSSSTVGVSSSACSDTTTGSAAGWPGTPQRGRSRSTTGWRPSTPPPPRPTTGTPRCAGSPRTPQTWGSTRAGSRPPGTAPGATSPRWSPLMARDRGGPSLAGQVLLYPVLEPDFETESYQRYATGHFNTRAAMRWYWEQYLGRRPRPHPTPGARGVRRAGQGRQPRRPAAGRASSPPAGTRCPPRASAMPPPCERTVSQSAPALPRAVPRLRHDRPVSSRRPRPANCCGPTSGRSGRRRRPPGTAPRRIEKEAPDDAEHR